MPALVFLASVGLALVTMLFVANAMLPDNGPVIVVSERIGLPEPWHPDTDPTSSPASAPMPTLGMTTQALTSTQPKSEAEGQTIRAAARMARAEAPQKKEKRVARQSPDRQQNHVQQDHVKQSSLVDRFSIRGQ